MINFLLLWQLCLAYYALNFFRPCSGFRGNLYGMSWRSRKISVILLHDVLTKSDTNNLDRVLDKQHNLENQKVWRLVVQYWYSKILNSSFGIKQVYHSLATLLTHCPLERLIYIPQLLK
ncbi:hypothetical protein GGS24DRAFT_378108 [Hypoxylon argillaceum]|nr:hypothetical protein GGS24DRAFT_378108 [Hypoxylon argillaceum]